MKKVLFEILPDGYVKNGFDKTKLKTIFEKYNGCKL